jgi:lysophospholipase L1-like esterase
MSVSTSRFWLWRMTGLVAGGATILFAAGFWLALRGTLGRPIGAAPPAPKAPQAVSKASVLVLGDSLARGTGDETGRGFAADVLEAVKKRGPGELANLSVNGAESPEVLDLVRSPNVGSLAASASLILLSIGGNDLSHAVPRGPEPESGVRAVEEVTAARSRYAQNLRASLTALRTANPAVPILIVGLYDPFGIGGPAGRLGSSVVLQWNTIQTETALAFPGVTVVPTFDLFEGRPDRLAVDKFHPNRHGYAAIAARMVQVLSSTP